VALTDDSHIDLEKNLRQAILTGRLVDLRSGKPEADDPAGGGEWDAQRTISAQVLVDLLTSSDGPRRQALRLAGARIIGSLDLEAAELVCPVLLEGCWFEEPAILAEASVSALRLPGCHLPALHAQHLTIRGDLELSYGFTASAGVRLRGAHIGGGLLLSGATLANPDGLALFADNLTVDQGMLCRQGFNAHGEIRLVGAHIGGNLELDGATLANPDGRALIADGLSVDQGMFCRDGFTAHGEIRLLGAHIGKQLSFDRATLTNMGGLALYADALIVDQSMFCRDGFTAKGEIRMRRAHIGGSLEFVQARLTNPDGVTLDFEQLRAARLAVGNLAEPPELVDLIHARVDALSDDPSSWPRQAYLHGFTYDALYEQPPVSAHQRLAWIRHDPDGYDPQPYEQLVAVYRRAGRDQDARTIAIAKQRARRRALPLPARAWSLLLDLLVGYGYRTWLAALWLLGFLIAGWVVFDLAHPAYLIAPRPPGERPLFHAGLYTLDLLLPIGDLNYQGAWIAHGWARGFWLGWILAGWVLTTAVVAALAGVLKRD
jgi:hypothetical protein